ncbi:hypothetical protein [Fibrella aquatilis]|uniref:Uncharacterized protein n=1 Tax=Fibrella aquatilis TaxID=2817059 RepID=A0A939GA08_9BACT|nr:hypothetical protein [Fibrella aquatilis]MBO0933740.1 hypothetical protein [Fibrella aquatilis]
MSQQTLGQATYPVVPDEDYEVYAIVGNYFSRCDDPKSAHLRNETWLVNTLTERYPTHGFWFKFDETPKQLAWRFPEKDPFYKKPAWWSFLASIDGSQFSENELTKLPAFICRKPVRWTNEQMDYYFKDENSRLRGYEAIRKDFPSFGAFIHFSRVAFSSDDTKAVCYFSETSDSLAGAGYLVFLEKKNGKWGVIDYTMLWIS